MEEVVSNNVGISRNVASTVLPDVPMQALVEGRVQPLPPDLAILRAELRADVQAMLDAQSESLSALFTTMFPLPHRHPTGTALAAHSDSAGYIAPAGILSGGLTPHRHQVEPSKGRMSAALACTASAVMPSVYERPCGQAMRKTNTMSENDRHDLKKRMFKTLNDANAKATFCEPHTDHYHHQHHIPHNELEEGTFQRQSSGDSKGSKGRRGSETSIRSSRSSASWKNGDVPEEFKIDGAFDFKKQQRHGHLNEEVYDVANFYWTSGFFQAVARSDLFQNLTLAVICANAVYIGVDADWNKAETPADMMPPFLISENVFCVFFLGELLIRFAAFEKKRNCLKDDWFKFDSLLVLLMVFETWVTPLLLMMVGGGQGLPTAPLRMLRLLRLSRMTRLMRSLPELVTMVKGMRVASRAVGSSLLMLAMLVYVFAIIMHMLLKEEESVEKYFATVPRCMWTLLMDGALMDSIGSVLTRLIDLEKWSCGLAVFVFMLFTLLSAMTVMNMLIGVLCEVVSAVAAAEKDEASIRLMKSTILIELKKFDDDGNGRISQEELQHVINDKHAIGVLRSLQVDVGYLRELQTMLFPEPTAEVSIESIMDLILMCRGDLLPTVKHVISGQAFTRWMVSHAMKVQHQLLEDQLDALAAQLDETASMQMLAFQASVREKSIDSKIARSDNALHVQFQQDRSESRSIGL